MRAARRAACTACPSARHRRRAAWRPPEEGEIARELEMPLSDYQQLLNDTNSGKLLPFEELIADGGELRGCALARMR